MCFQLVAANEDLENKVNGKSKLTTEEEQSVDVTDKCRRLQAENAALQKNNQSNLE